MLETIPVLTAVRLGASEPPVLTVTAPYDCGLIIGAHLGSTRRLSEILNNPIHLNTQI